MNGLIKSIRNSHLYSRVILVIGLLFLVYLVYFTMMVLPIVDASSIQAGLTLVSELLGVILGALLVIIVLLIDQLHQTESILENSHSSYHAKFKQQRRTIISTRNKIIKLVESGKVALDDKASAVTSLTFRKVISSLASLTFYFEASSPDTIEILKRIGFTSQEIDNIEMVGSASILEPYFFFTTLKNSLNIYAIQQWVSKSAFNLLIDLTQRFSRDGIVRALARYEISKSFLQSHSLAVALATTILTLFISIFTIFGVTPDTYGSLSVVLPLYISLVGFIASVMLTSFSIRKMFSVGDNPIAEQYYFTGS